MSNKQGSAAGRSLLDDCFAHDPKRMPALEALALLRDRLSTVAGPETVPLDAAHGRLLAEPLVAERDVPAFDNVAVDGYAFAHASLSVGDQTWLRLLPGRSAAGRPFPGEIGQGDAVRVLTGGALPAGADTAVMQEDVVIENDRLLVPPGLKPGANCRLAGEDMRRGEAVLLPGQRLRPQEIGIAAALGQTSLSVFERLKVALVSSGDEILPAGEPLGHGMTYNSNGPMLLGLLRRLEVNLSDQGIWPDRRDKIQKNLGSIAQEHHVIIATGGASKGDEDHMVDAVKALGQLHFWQIAIKPGRPLAFGQIGGTVFIGLPGNPVAAMVCFLLFARPVLIALGGGGWVEPSRFPVRSGFSMTKKSGRREYLRARLVHGDHGDLRVQKIEREGSGILTSLSEADGLIEVDEATTSISPGDPLSFMSFSDLFH